MSSPEAFNTIHDRIVELWTATPVIFENEDTPTPDTPAAFLFVEVAGDLFEQASIGGGDQVGDNLWREDGQVLIHVMTPRGGGSAAARLLARQAAALFRGQDIDGIRFGGVSIGAGEPGEADGNYWRMTATIDFERDE
jgi:hypothetical protein